MPKKAKVKYKSLRSNLIHLPLSLYASLTQQQIRPQSLVLHVEPLTPSSSRATAAYLGWSGLASASSLAGGLGGEETIEVDPEVAMSLGWNEGMLVEISIINNPTKARSVSVTPLTEDDWEILEQHASFLEENLLMQLRSATKGRTYDIWVNRTKILIRVDETNPKTSENSTVLLHPGTEIYVAPRLRKAGTEPAHSAVMNVNDHSNGVPKDKGRSIKIRLIPGRVASRWGQPSPAMEVGDLENVFYCSEGTLRRVRRRLGQEGDGGVYVKAERTGDKPKSVSIEVAGDEGKVIELEGWLMAWKEMPAGCCVLAGPAKEDWSDWAKIRLYVSSPPRGRLKGTKTKDMSTIAFASPPFQEIALLSGLDSEHNEAISYLQRSIITSTRPLLITGGKGSGKTTLVKAIATTLESDRDMVFEPTYEDVARLDSEGRLKEMKAKIEGWLEDAKRKRPAVLILDGLDSLLAPEHELTPSRNPTILAELFCRLFTPESLVGIVVIATASSSSALHELLNTKHIFGETIKIAALTKEKRRDILSSFAQASTPQIGTPAKMPGDDIDFVTLASKTEGYSISDLGDLVNNASQQATIRSSKQSSGDHRLAMEDFDTAQATFTPVSLRGVTLQKSSVQWSDIGGLHEPRRVLRETLEWPTKYAQIFASCPLRLRSGVLLYGYPGCGKTLLASAVAKECGLNFISVKGPEILNKYIGASEKSVRDLFERASAAKPCILFFDEFDSIAPKRGHDSTGVTDRVVNQMLTEMDGAQGLEGVYVLAATSRPDLIDSALLRPGRLDKSLLCDMPNEEERLEAISGKLQMSSDVDFGALAKETKGLSGADLQALVYNAHLDVVHSSISTTATDAAKKNVVNGNAKISGGERKYRQIAPPIQESSVSNAEKAELGDRIDSIIANLSFSRSQGGGGEKPKVEQKTPIIEHHHLLKSLGTTRPSVSPADRARLFKIYSEFSNDRDGKVSNGEMGKETGTRSSLM